MTTRGLLEGRVAIITGGARGIGAAVARLFADQGAVGAVLDLVSSIDIEVPDNWSFHEADVRSPDSLRMAFEAALAEYHHVDIVVANAGIVPPWSTTVDIDLAEWQRVFDVNSTGAMLTMREAVRVMSDHGGAIVATSSLNGWRGDPHIAAYAASKHAVVGLVRSVALDAGQYGIRVNAVGPGPIATDALLTRMDQRSGTTGLAVAEAVRQAGATTALGRIATVEEVASAVLFLASDLSSGITGHLLPVDGGIL